ncbi:MAG: PorT family protein [Flammeovirgaceae bacterium]|nr:PorT family protein [Flammeovirgaceae bacterium]
MNFKKIACFIVFTVLAGTTLLAQDEKPELPAGKEKKGRPNIPGTFLIDIGVNAPSNKPSDFDIGFWGSRTLNLYYQYDMQIGKSKFSFHPGIGIGFERFKFSDDKTIGYDDFSGDTLKMVDTGLPSIRKSQLIANYLDIPLELRFSTNPYDPSRSFKVAVGVRGGVLVDSFTKVKYKEDGEMKKIKNKENYNLNPIRYGVHMRIGVGNFNFFTYYNLSTLFEEKDLGLQKKGMSNITMGFSLAGF